MKSASSSFIDSPRQYDVEKIESLQYKVNTLETEKQLVQQEQGNHLLQLEARLMKKNEEYNKLKTNFNFVYEEKTQLLTKVENQAQIHSTNLDSLNRTITQLKNEKTQQQKRYDDLDSSHNRTIRKYEHVRSDFNYQLNLNDELTKEFTNLNTTIGKLQSSNDDLVNKLKVNSSVQLNKPSNSHLNTSLQLKNSLLQKTNIELQLKIDKLLQNKTSVELLKQKNLSLTTKVVQLEAIQEKYYKLEIENIDLNDKLTNFTRILDEKLDDAPGEDVQTKIKNFVDAYKKLQYDLLIYTDKYTQSQQELTQLQKNVTELELHIEDLTQDIKDLTNKNNEKSTVIDKLERSKVLNLKEVEYLRNLLKELDKLSLRRDQEHDDNNKSTNQYLTNLEKLVDGYKNEISSLQEQARRAHTQTQATPPPIKKQRLEHPSKPKTELENIQLLSTVKSQEDQISDLTIKIKSLTDLKEKKNQLQILQLKSNPAAQSLIVKQQTLDLLLKENEDLIAKYVNNTYTSELIPKSIFERQENDKAILGTKIDQLSKRINRLKNIYSQKSKDILTIISKYFGYIIEFLPSSINPNDLSSRIKLTSRYMTDQDLTSYLVIDIELKSLKAYGNYEFKQMYEELLSSYGHEQIPCFLSALNLKIFERYIVI